MLRMTRFGKVRPRIASTASCVIGVWLSACGSGGDPSLSGAAGAGGSSDTVVGSVSGASASAGNPSPSGGPSGGGSFSSAGTSSVAGGPALSNAGAGGALSSAGAGGGTSGAGSAQAGATTASEPASCAPGGPGMNTCGADGHESCCISLLLEGGTFARTYANTGSGATGKADNATVSSFRLDKYEVTVGRLRQFVNYLAGGGAPPTAGSGKHVHLNGGKGLADSSKAGTFEPGWDASWNENLPTGADALANWTKNLACSSCTYGTWTAKAGGDEDLPVTFLDWYEAHAFCIWDGGFLPSEAEWRYAAAGGDEQRMYPWGTTAPGTDSKYAMYDCYYPSGKPGNCTSLANVAKVGTASLGGGRWGQLDLSGSVWEWNLDVYSPKFDSTCSDCAHLTGGSERVLPGGGFHTGLMPYMLASSRTQVDYATTYRGDYGVGVRCARTP